MQLSPSNLTPFLESSNSQGPKTEPISPQIELVSLVVGLWAVSQSSNVSDELEAAGILPEPCEEHGASHAGSSLTGLCFWQVSSISHYFEREVKHLDYVEQRKKIREQEKKEMELENEKKKVVS